MQFAFLFDCDINTLSKEDLFPYLSYLYYVLYNLEQRLSVRCHNHCHAFNVAQCLCNQRFALHVQS